MRLDALGIDEDMQELAAKFHPRARLAVLGRRRFASHHRLAAQLDLAAVGVAQGSTRRGHGQFASLVERANSRLIDLERIGIWIMPGLRSEDLAFQTAGRIERLHRKAAHEIVWLVSSRALNLARCERWCISRQPIRA